MLPAEWLPTVWDDEEGFPEHDRVKEIVSRTDLLAWAWTRRVNARVSD